MSTIPTEKGRKGEVVGGNGGEGMEESKEGCVVRMINKRWKPEIMERRRRRRRSTRRRRWRCRKKK